MSIRTSPWPPGTPCWADLSAPDVDDAAARYAEAFGWQVERGGPEYGGYATCLVRGSAAAGIGPAQDGAPPAWTLYLATDDVDATAAAVTEAGGSVLAPPFDVMEQGRMAVVADPTGAVFGLWQAGASIGSAVVNEPGGLVWEDLRSTDPDAARAFYAAVFGFRFQAVEGAPEGYTTFSLEDGVPLGGMGGMMGGPPGALSHWVPYVAVSDVETASAAITRGGGSVLHGPDDTPWGRLALVADPTGASLCVMQTSGDGTPDRSG